MKRSAAIRLFTSLALVFSHVLTRRVPVRVLCRSLSVATFACCTAMLSANAALAAIDYNTVGGSYAQNFDSLPNSPTNTSPVTSGQEWTDDSTAPTTDYVSIAEWFH